MQRRKLTMTVYRDNQKLNRKIDWIAYYQIGGGILGVVFILDLIYKNISILQLNALIFIIPILFYSFSLCSGYTLLKQRELGKTLTLINQSLQIPQISFFGFSYQYYAGLFLGVGLTEISNIGFNFSFSDFKFVLDNNNDEIVLMANIVPIIIINRLKKYSEQIEINNSITNSLEEDNRK